MKRFAHKNLYSYSETLRTRVTDAVFKKKSTNIFFSIPPRPHVGDSMEHNDGGDNLDGAGDNNGNEGFASPSVRQIARQRQRRMTALSYGDKEGQKLKKMYFLTRLLTTISFKT